MANLLLMRGTSIGLVTNVNELQLGIDVEKRPPGGGPTRAHADTGGDWHVQTGATGSVEGLGTEPKSRLRRITADEAQTQSPPKKQPVVSCWSQAPPGGMAPTPVLPIFAWR